MRAILSFLFMLLAFGFLEAQNIRELTITSTTINGETQAGSLPEFTVNEGGYIGGTVTARYVHNQSEDHMIPLAATPNWGDKQNDYWTIEEDILNGSYTTGNMSLFAPSTSGTYYIILAAQSDYTTAQVLSATSWNNVPNVVWNDGNDLFDLTNSQLEQARANGTLTLPRLFNTYVNTVYGVTAIKLNVVPAVRQLTLTSTTINGSTKTSSAPTFTVNTGANISGSFTVKYVHNQPEKNQIPLAATPNWGNKTSDYWLVKDDITNGSYTNGNISLTAPSTPGNYYIILAAYSDYTAAQVLSATAWTNEPDVVWNDGNDLFDLTETQLNTARSTGTLDWQRLKTSFQDAVYGVTAIKLIVETSNYITVTAPASGAIWHAGSTHEITWTDNFSDNVKIEWYDDDWNLLDILAPSVTNTGSYSWEIPNTIPNHDGYKIKVLRAADNDIFDWSTNDFMISNIDVSSELQLPYTASSTSVDVISNVDWSVTDNATWLEVERKGAAIEVTYQENAGSSSRPAIITLEGGGIIRTISVSQAASGKKITVTAPASGVVWHAGSTYEISWTDNISDNVKIEWYAEDWTLLDVLTESVSNTGSFSWEIPFTIPNHDNYKIKVLNAADNDIFDWSDNLFKISNIDVGSELHLPNSSGSTSVDVISNVDWGVTVNAAWLTVERKGDAIDITYEDNTGSSRPAIITLEGGGISRTIDISQQAFSCDISVDPDKQDVDFLSGESSFPISTSLADWSVSVDKGWLEARKNGNAVDVEYDANLSSSPRSATISISSGDCKVTATLNQEGNPFPIQQLIISSTTINGSTQLGSNPEFDVTAKQDIEGEFTVEYTHNQSEDPDIPLVATPNWGDRRHDYWLVREDITNGSSTTGNVSLTAPQSAGTYHIILAAQSGFTAEQILSATSKNEASVVWDDGNDLFELNMEQLIEARLLGTLGLPILDWGYHPVIFGITAIRLNVGPSNIEAHASHPIEIYPNPTSDLLTVSFGKLIEYSIEIYNNLGQKVYAKEGAAQREVIDLGAYSGGVFIVVVTDRLSSEQLRSKIIKR